MPLWVNQDTLGTHRECPLLPRKRPNRCMTATDAWARSRQVLPLGRVQTLLSMCAPNISTVVGKRIGMRVLLIEDDSATAQSIELMLKSESFNFYTTDLGEEGIDLGKIYDYDIILLDLNLPDMSGFEVLRRLRISKVTTPIQRLLHLRDIRLFVDARFSEPPSAASRPGSAPRDGASSPVSISRSTFAARIV